LWPSEHRDEIAAPLSITFPAARAVSVPNELQQHDITPRICRVRNLTPPIEGTASPSATGRYGIRFGAPPSGLRISSARHELECRKWVNRVFCATSAGWLLHLEQRTSNLTNRSAEYRDAESERQRRNEHRTPLHRVLA
jgi:hypothetical protein